MGIMLTLASPNHGLFLHNVQTNMEAAGLDGLHKWGITLPSSARVSHKIYEPAIAILYPHLCERYLGGWTIGQPGSQAPHGSDRRFLRDESQSSCSHGVRGNLDLHRFLSIPSGLGEIGGVGSLSTGSPSGRGSGYLGLMYSQAPVRSYTKDRAGLRGDHTLKRGRI